MSAARGMRARISSVGERRAPSSRAPRSGDAPASPQWRRLSGADLRAEPTSAQASWRIADPPAPFMGTRPAGRRGLDAPWGRGGRGSVACREKRTSLRRFADAAAQVDDLGIARPLVQRVDPDGLGRRRVGDVEPFDALDGEDRLGDGGIGEDGVAHPHQVEADGEGVRADHAPDGARAGGRSITAGSKGPSSGRCWALTGTVSAMS